MPFTYGLRAKLPGFFSGTSSAFKIRKMPPNNPDMNLVSSRLNGRPFTWSEGYTSLGLSTGRFEELRSIQRPTFTTAWQKLLPILWEREACNLHRVFFSRWTNRWSVLSVPQANRIFSSPVSKRFPSELNLTEYTVFVRAWFPQTEFLFPSCQEPSVPPVLCTDFHFHIVCRSSDSPNSTGLHTFRSLQSRRQIPKSQSAVLWAWKQVMPCPIGCDTSHGLWSDTGRHLGRCRARRACRQHQVSCTRAYQPVIPRSSDRQFYRRVLFIHLFSVHSVPDCLSRYLQFLYDLIFLDRLVFNYALSRVSTYTDAI